MSFKYKLNQKIVGVQQSQNQELINATELSNVDTRPNQHGIQNLFTHGPAQLIKYPIFALPKPYAKVVKPKIGATDVRGSLADIGERNGVVSLEADVEDGRGEEHGGGHDDNLKIKVVLDFGRFFAWLERFLWLTMLIGIGWALIKDFEKATQEECTKGGSMKTYPLNILPSLSRTMSSFRVGTFLWTIFIALAFVARLASNNFLHKLYDSWYQDTPWNKFFLLFSYYADNLEIISLLMIPAYSLDCDPDAHRFFFVLFLALTYLAEILQYSTRFLKRKPDFLFHADVLNYYAHIGILILLQTFFVLWMLVGYYLHEYVCAPFLYSIFTFGEYATVVVNVRFKRDTVLFVK